MVAVSHRLDPQRRRAAAGAAGMAGVAAVVGLVGPDLPASASACPAHLLLGLDCPVCGATRGLHALLNGDLGAALSHNVLLAAVVPLAVLWWAAMVRQAAGGPVLAYGPPSRRAWIGLAVLLVAFTLARNLALPGLAWLDAA